MLKQIIFTAFVFFFIVFTAAHNKKKSVEQLKNFGEQNSYEFIMKTRNLNQCYDFELAFPKSKYLKEIGNLKDELFFIDAYGRATKNFQIDSLNLYLENFPKGNYKGKVLEIIDIISWQKARTDNTLMSYQNYIKKFPQGKAVKYAREAIFILKQKKN